MPLRNQPVIDPADKEHSSNIGTSRTPKSPKGKMGLHHISLYEADEDPKKNWFVYEKFWFQMTLLTKINKWHNSQQPGGNVH